MQTDYKLKQNEELYGDFELIPLSRKAVDQRVNFFEKKVAEQIAIDFMIRDNQTLTKYMKAREFWKEIREKHCLEKEDSWLEKIKNKILYKD